MCSGLGEWWLHKGVLNFRKLVIFKYLCSNCLRFLVLCKVASECKSIATVKVINKIYVHNFSVGLQGQQFVYLRPLSTTKHETIVFFFTYVCNILNFMQIKLLFKTFFA